MAVIWQIFSSQAANHLVQILATSPTGDLYLGNFMAYRNSKFQSQNIYSLEP